MLIVALIAVQPFANKVANQICCNGDNYLENNIRQAITSLLLSDWECDNVKSISEKKTDGNILYLQLFTPQVTDLLFHIVQWDKMFSSCSYGVILPNIRKNIMISSSWLDYDILQDVSKIIWVYYCINLFNLSNIYTRFLAVIML